MLEQILEFSRYYNSLCEKHSLETRLKAHWRRKKNFVSKFVSLMWGTLKTQISVSPTSSHWWRVLTKTRLQWQIEKTKKNRWQKIGHIYIIVPNWSHIHTSVSYIYHNTTSSNMLYYIQRFHIMVSIVLQMLFSSIELIQIYLKCSPKFLNCHWFHVSNTQWCKTWAPGLVVWSHNLSMEYWWNIGL